MAMLMVGDLCVKDLAQPLALSLPAITKHVRILEQAGLVQKTKQAQWRSCHLRNEQLQEVAKWLDPYRQLWEARLDLLEKYVEETKSEDLP